MPVLWSSMGWISHLHKMQFLIVSRRKSQEFSQRRLFLRVVHDCLSKCPNSKKVPCYAPGMVAFTNFNCVSKYLSVYGAEAAIEPHKN